MKVFPVILLIAGIAFATRFVLGAIGHRAARRNTSTAARTLAVVQLARWAVVLATPAVIGVFVFAEAGVPPTVLAGASTLGAMTLAFGLQHLVEDYLAIATFVAERQGDIGQVLTVNETATGIITRFGLRTLTLRTWDSADFTIRGSKLETWRNESTAPSRAVVDIDIPVDLDREQAVTALTARCREAAAGNPIFQSEPVVLGTSRQLLGHFELRVTALVDPAKHLSAQYLLRDCGVDVVRLLLSENASTELAAP